MPRLSRRRFIAISAATALAGPASAAPKRYWTGTALGARASITLDHPDAAEIVMAVLREIDRLEDVFSLYRPDSALSRLNRDGSLDAPPFELVECLGIAGAVHDATGGAFDPTIQPLWTTYAEAYAAGGTVTGPMLEKTRSRIGWSSVSIAPSQIAFARSGMALTLNGIAQGYVADRVARMLEAQGLDRILIDTGEVRALGGMPSGAPWSVSLPDGRAFRFRDRALATSAPLGTSFDAAETIGHILDPRTGLPAPATARTVSVTAPTAALADALSTGFCLLADAEAKEAIGRLRDCRLV
ncbi:FAD:protein FMN transferase [Roseovarius sp.]|uniref:FAD:protein FMN transferase n=1 Tax=Roseovarius sp. TaxID=1486281 RepID=UPI002637FA0C|nr:FAD:protein FMN transferase [Roseovarius sp.]